MGVGLYLTGRYRAAADDTEAWLDRVRSWLEERAGEPLEKVRLGRDGGDNPAVVATLHPCAEDLEITVLGPGRVVATGKTSGAGPGYHVYLCDLLHRLGEDLAITWEAPDPGSGEGGEAGYFHTGDARALEEDFLQWLHEVVVIVIEGLENDYQWLMISMAIGHHYRHHGPLVTPMGPRDLDWLRAVAEDPRRGIDLFPWWTPGVGAPFYLGRALARMWRDVRWRAPLTEDEGRLLMDVHLDLARAHRLDPSLDYPWREWRELMESIEAHFGYVEMAGDEIETEVRRRAAEMTAGASSPPIGYRRRPVRVDLTDGWSIEVPGEMSEAWDEEGLWTARDTQRGIFFKSYGLSKGDGSKPAVPEILDGLPLPDGPRLEHRKEGMVGRAVLTSFEGDDGVTWRLTGHTAIEGGLTVCHVVFRDPDERDWAVATWRSLEHA
jgi:hypothetical protein